MLRDTPMSISTPSHCVPRSMRSTNGFIPRSTTETLFAALDRVEAILERRRYLCGDRLTEADVRLFTTLVRFDCVYVSHFKCNVRRLVDYPNLWGYTRDIFQLPGVAETVNLEHIKRHYFESHRQINPFGIVPDGPDVDFEIPHSRGS